MYHTQKKLTDVCTKYKRDFLPELTKNSNHVNERFFIVYTFWWHLQIKQKLVLTFQKMFRLSIKILASWVMETTAMVSPEHSAQQTVKNLEE